MYESSTNTGAIVAGIVIAQAVICAFASAFLASSKNRSVSGYFGLGLFFGIIGLLIAIGVPKLEAANQPHADIATTIKNARCVENIEENSKPTVGDIHLTAESLVFTSNRQTIFEIPVQKIQRAEIKSERWSTLADVRITHGDVSKTTITQFEAATYNMSPFYKDINTLVLNAGERKSHKNCPYCAETILAAAVKCKHCGSDLIGAPPAPPSEQIGTVKHDIGIGGEVAFRTGEQISIESISPDPTRPEYKYVVLSKLLNKRFRLSDKDIS